MEICLRWFMFVYFEIKSKSQREKCYTLYTTGVSFIVTMRDQIRVALAFIVKTMVEFHQNGFGICREDLQKKGQGGYTSSLLSVWPCNLKQQSLNPLRNGCKVVIVVNLMKMISSFPNLFFLKKEVKVEEDEGKLRPNH